MTIDWGGTDEDLIRGIEAYTKAIFKAVRAVADYFQAVLEAWAKEHAKWTDRTGNARQALAAYIDDEVPATFNADEASAYIGGKLGEDIVTLYLSHGMSYGVALEKRYAGKYAIIWPTIEAHLPEIERMLKGIFA